MELPLIDRDGVDGVRKASRLDQRHAATDSAGNAVGEDRRDLGQRVTELAGEPFNLNSPLQLGEILFEKLGLPAGKKTKRGYSTSADILGADSGQASDRAG